MAEFINAIDYTLKNEGSAFTQDPSDPGGATKFGITENMLSFKRGAHCTPEDVKALQKDEAEMVYFVFFWMPLKLTQVTSQPVATAIFDIAVNIGMTRAVRFAQIACCIAGVAVNADGKSGDHTTEAINKTPPKEFMAAFQHQVIEHYEDLVKKNPHLNKFLTGWTNRADRLSELLINCGVN